MTDPCELTGLEDSPRPLPEGQGPVTDAGQPGLVRFYYGHRAARSGARGVRREGTAELFDVSQDRAALVASHEIRPGTVLLVHFPTARPEGTLTQLARAGHARRLGPLRWLIGCAFLSRLGEGDVEQIRHALDVPCPLT